MDGQVISITFDFLCLEKWNVILLFGVHTSHLLRLQSGCVFKLSSVFGSVCSRWRGRGSLPKMADSSARVRFTSCILYRELVFRALSHCSRTSARVSPHRRGRPITSSALVSSPPVFCLLASWSELQPATRGQRRSLTWLMVSGLN